MCRLKRKVVVALMLAAIAPSMMACTVFSASCTPSAGSVSCSFNG
jgi:hypothetical protein